jgi:hypothetical protein
MRRIAICSAGIVFEEQREDCEQIPEDATVGPRVILGAGLQDAFKNEVNRQ